MNSANATSRGSQTGALWLTSQLSQFLGVSIIGVTLTVASLVYLHVKLTEGYIDTHLDSHNQNLGIVLRNSLVQAGLEQELVSGRDQLSPSTRAEIESIVERELRLVPIIKFKIYNRNGTVVYSTKTSEIGDDATHNKGFQSAIAGIPASGKVDPDHMNEFDRVIEIQNIHQQYIPIRTENLDKPIGVFETYLDIIGIVKNVEAMQRATFWIVGCVLGAIYLALALTFLRTHRLLREESRQREAHLHEITEMRNSLEQRVSERTRELGYARDFLQAIMDHVPDAILTCNSNFIVDSANRTALDLFNQAETELIGKNLAEFFPEDASAALLDPEFSGHRQLELESDGGPPVPVDLWKGTLKNDDGHLLYIVVLRDITSQILAQRDLEMARKQYFHQEKMAAIGQLAAGILHEVGNPIAAIAGAAGEVKAGFDGKDENDVVEQNIELIDEQITRLGKIIREIAEFASPRPRARELLDLNGLLRSTVNLLTYDQRFGSIGVRLDLDRNLPAIVGVADQLIQVFMNLLINAMDACASFNLDSDSIVVTSELDGDRIHVCVEDHGSGMSAEVLEHVTETFYTTKAVGEGTGLGLSLCETIVNDHGGELRIESEQGKGTRVHVFLPLEPSDAAEPEQPAVEEQ